MMNTRILTVCAAFATFAGISFAFAQGYASPPPAYSTAPPPDYGPRPAAMEAMPDFDALQDDEDSPRAQAALPTPGPVLSPSDPRYGRPPGAPVYSDRAVPQGPVMSPDDPRYGRPM